MYTNGSMPNPGAATAACPYHLMQLFVSHSKRWYQMSFLPFYTFWRHSQFFHFYPKSERTTTTNPNITMTLGVLKLRTDNHPLVSSNNSLCNGHIPLGHSDLEITNSWADWSMYSVVTSSKNRHLQGYPHIWLKIGQLWFCLVIVQ